MLTAPAEGVKPYEATMEDAQRPPARRSTPSGARAVMGPLWVSPPGGPSSDGVFAALAGADADGLLEAVDENLAVADPAGLARLLDGLDHGDHLTIGHHDLDLDLGHEVHDVRRAAIHFLLAARATEALHLGDSHPLDSNFTERVLHFVELERLDDRFDLLHCVLLFTVKDLYHTLTPALFQV